MGVPLGVVAHLGMASKRDIRVSLPDVMHEGCELLLLGVREGVTVMGDQLSVWAGPMPQAAEEEDPYAILIEASAVRPLIANRTTGHQLAILEDDVVVANAEQSVYPAVDLKPLDRPAYCSRLSVTGVEDDPACPLSAAIAYGGHRYGCRRIRMS